MDSASHTVPKPRKALPAAVFAVRRVFRSSSDMKFNQKDISSPSGTIFTLRLPPLHSIMPPT